MCRRMGATSPEKHADLAHAVAALSPSHSPWRLFSVKVSAHPPLFVSERGACLLRGFVGIVADSHVRVYARVSARLARTCRPGGVAERATHGPVARAEPSVPRDGEAGRHPLHRQSAAAGHASGWAPGGGGSGPAEHHPVVLPAQRSQLGGAKQRRAGAGQQHQQQHTGAVLHAPAPGR